MCARMRTIANECICARVSARWAAREHTGSAPVARVGKHSRSRQAADEQRRAELSWCSLGVVRRELLGAARFRRGCRRARWRSCQRSRRPSPVQLCFLEPGRRRGEVEFSHGRPACSWGLCLPKPERRSGEQPNLSGACAQTTEQPNRVAEEASRGTKNDRMSEASGRARNERRQHERSERASERLRNERRQHERSEGASERTDPGRG